MRLLSFDTSTEVLHLALLLNDQPVLERTITSASFPTADVGPPASLSITAEAAKSPSPRIKKRPLLPARQEAASLLMPAVDEAFNVAGWKRSELDCVVVGVGPGSFTGIRTAVVTGRAIAQGLSLPLLAVSRMECFATMCELPAGLVLSAARDHFFIAAFSPENDPHSNAQVQIPMVRGISLGSYVSIEHIGEMLAQQPRWYVDDQAFERLQSIQRELLCLPEVKNYATRQGQIAWNRLSLKMLQECSTDLYTDKETDRLKIRAQLKALFPYQLVQPLYLRGPSITVKSYPETETLYGNQNPANAPGRH